MRMYNGRALARPRRRWGRTPKFMVSRLDGIALPKPRLRRVVGWTAALGLVVALGTGIPDAYSGLQGSDLFMVKKISVEGNRLLAQTEIVDRSGVEVGGNLFQADLQTATDSLCAHLLIRKALLLRRPPGDLVISLEEREPVAWVSQMDGLVGLDVEATCFELPPFHFDLPVVTSFSSLVADTMEVEGSPAALRLVRFLQDLREDHPGLWDQLSEVGIVTPSEGRLFMIDGSPDLLVRFDHLDEQVEKYRAFAARKVMPETVAYVDLRYEGQVVVGRGGVISDWQSGIRKLKMAGRFAPPFELN